MEGTIRAGARAHKHLGEVSPGSLSAGRLDQRFRGPPLGHLDYPTIGIDDPRRRDPLDAQPTQDAGMHIP